MSKITIELSTMRDVNKLMPLQEDDDKKPCMIFVTDYDMCYQPSVARLKYNDGTPAHDVCEHHMHAFIEKQAEQHNKATE